MKRDGLEILDKTEIKAEFLELLEKKKKMQGELEVIKAEIGLVISVAKTKGLDLEKQYGGN